MRCGEIIKKKKAGMKKLRREKRFKLIIIIKFIYKYSTSNSSLKFHPNPYHNSAQQSERNYDINLKKISNKKSRRKGERNQEEKEKVMRKRKGRNV